MSCFFSLSKVHPLFARLNLIQLVTGAGKAIRQRSLNVRLDITDHLRLFPCGSCML